MAFSLGQVARLCRGSWALGSSSSKRPLSSSAIDPNFGILFDIDGVLVRGKKVLPFAPGAFKRLVDDRGQFRVPVVFVTNGGNTLRQTKADQLSQWLEVEIQVNQVVMAHSPLKRFSEYHNKRVLVNGQGQVEEIAASLGFTNFITMDQLRDTFPVLDNFDHNRRQEPNRILETPFPPIEAIALFGEPIRWETCLQLIIDLLVTNGSPDNAPSTTHYPHIPILACNMDLLWMAEAVMPRFGHGAFLTCLESLYKKTTGLDLRYTAMIGKPSEITLRHGEQMLQEHAKLIGLSEPVRNLYFVGDNLCTDIFGANLYNRYLSNRVSREAQAGSKGNMDRFACKLDMAEKCYSILVETGVFSKETGHLVNFDHSPRDFLPVDQDLQNPNFVVHNANDALDLIFEKEQFK